ncbi:MAG: endonuclease/exonuclease/phosphatase family protein [Winogradskyella sp.]|jgi:hypothetical protein
MKIFFWNINKELTNKEVKLIATEINPDIIFLAECNVSIGDILLALNDKSVSYFYNIDPICSKIKMFSKFHDKFVMPITSNNRYTVRSINIPTYPIFNLMCIHFQSKVNWDFADQAAHSMELNTVINDFEKKTKNINTIIIGDFNMNPFDFGMVQTTGLHSVMSKEVALKKKRTVDGKEYPFFYNPMWSFFGDDGKGTVNGTIYNTLSKPINYFWNTFDQVIIRPEFLDHFEESELEIITELGSGVKLIKNSSIIDDSISDHLPISIKIKR